MRQIGNPGQQVAERIVQSLDLLVQRRDALAHRADVLLAFAGVDVLLAEFRDLRALGGALRLELLGFGDGGAPLGVEFAELRYVQREPARCQALGHRVQVAAEER